MIDIVVSTDCKYCSVQIDNMKKSFFDDEYRIISMDSEEFETYDQKDAVDGLPFVVVREDGTDGEVKYSGIGVHDGTELRKIERRPRVEPFNLHKVRANS